MRASLRKLYEVARSGQAIVEGDVLREADDTNELFDKDALDVIADEAELDDAEGVLIWLFVSLGSFWLGSGSDSWASILFGSLGSVSSVASGSSGSG